ncbi:MAG: NAD-dependent epimerase/dehydratase family protein [Gemmatimonadales bacterium]
MTVLVTGGSGLVGSHVLEALRSRGEPVRALVRRESGGGLVAAFGAEPVIGDVTDAETWRRAAAGVRGIVHAAALVAHRAPFEAFERVNVGGTRLATEAARRAGARLIHVSSVAVYGRSVAYTAGRHGVAEDFPFQPLPQRDFYARTKRMAEELVQREAEASRGSLSAVAIRPNVIYGERDRLFTPRLIATLRRGLVPQIGPGTNHLSCVYAGNVASAVVAALDAPPRGGFRAYNVTHDAPPLLTQREFLAAFAEALGVRLRCIPIPILIARVAAESWSGVLRTLRPRRYAGLASAAVWFLVGENPYVTERIRAELGWTPPLDARAAIQRSVTWFAGR